MSELRATEGDIRHALKNEIRNRAEPNKHLVAAVVATAYDEDEQAVANVLDRLKKEGEVYVVNDGLRVTDNHTGPDAATISDDPEETDLAPGTLDTVRDVIESHNGDDAVPFSKLADILPWDDETVFEALAVLERRGEIYRPGAAEFTHHDDGDHYALADRHE